MPLSRRALGVMGAFIGLTPCAALGHGDDPKLRDFRGPYVGPGYRASLQDAPPINFASSNMTLMSWLPPKEFGQQMNSGNSCWGYVSPAGREIAIMGLSAGTGFVDVSDPGNAQIIAVIPGPPSLWHDVKVYQGRCYVVSEGGQGIQVIDMRDIDNGNVKLINTVTTPGTAATHTVAVNEDSGFLYRCGGGSNGLRIYDLSDPNQPAWVATWNTRYVHECQVVSYKDGPYAGREFAFLCSGFNGGFVDTRLEILDVTNKNDIFQVGQVFWPQAGFSHQVWLSEDRKFAYLNDEFDEGNYGLKTTTLVFDVSNLSQPTLVNKFTNNQTAVGHNLYVRGNLLFESNYTTGLRVFDLSVNPQNPPEIAYIDTRPENDAATFNGAWSNYPFLPSGTILISDIERGLFVVRLGLPQIKFEFLDELPPVLSPKQDGFKLKITAENGAVKAGSEMLHYHTSAGWNATPLFAIGGDVYAAVFNNLPCGETIEYYVSASTTSGLTFKSPEAAPQQGTLSAITAYTVKTLMTDDLEAPGGWTAGVPGDNAKSGIWTWVNPNGTAAQPEDDHTPGLGELCFVTGQGTPGGPIGENDVDGGQTTLLTPELDVTGISDPYLEFWAWYSNDKGGGPQDEFMRIDFTHAPLGGSWFVGTKIGPMGPGSTGGWLRYELRVKNYLSNPTKFFVRFQAADTGPDTIVEAAVDDVRLFAYSCQDTCPADLDKDGLVGQSDLGILLGDYGCSAAASGFCPGDIDGDGVTGQSDLGVLLSAWGTVCE